MHSQGHHLLSELDGSVDRGEVRWVWLCKGGGPWGEMKWAGNSLVVLNRGRKKNLN